MTMNQLIFFKEAARLQHFNRAAEALNISEPSLSRSISSLEHELGVILFEKKGRNVTLTKTGMVFSEHVDKILEDIEIAKDKMREYATDGGHIDIAYVAPLAKKFIPGIVRNFLNYKENRNVIFNFSQNTSIDNIAGLKKGLFDIAFGSYIEDEKDICFVPVLEQEMVVILPADHPLASVEEFNINEFDNYPLLSYESASGLGKRTRKFFRTYDLHPNIICESPDEEGISALVAAGFGIALVVNVDAIHRKDIIIKKIADDITVKHTVYMCYLKEKYQIPVVQRLIKFIENKLDLIDKEMRGC